MDGFTERPGTLKRGIGRVLKAGIGSQGQAFCLTGCVLVSGHALAETEYNASTSVFGQVEHRSTDNASDTDPGAGVSAHAGIHMDSGANKLDGSYGVEIETQSGNSDNSDDTTFVGSSRYDYLPEGGRFDFNAGHTIRFVRNDTGLTADPGEYDTQNSISSGAGVWFYPGDLTRLRLSTQAGISFAQNDLPQNKSLNTSASLYRSLSERSDFILTGGRTWADQDDTADTTLDKAEMGLQSQLETGSFNILVGGSRITQNDSDFEAVTGSVSRVWQSDWSSFVIGYNRELTSTALDLSTSPLSIPDFSDAESVRLEDATLEQSVNLGYTSSRVCDACRLRLNARGTSREDVRSEVETKDYVAGIGLSLDVTSTQTLDFSYFWQGEELDDEGGIDDQVHRFRAGWRRYLTEKASVGVSLIESISRGVTDEDRFVARVSFTYGWNGRNDE